MRKYLFLFILLIAAFSSSAQCTPTLTLVNPNYGCNDTIYIQASPGVSYIWYYDGVATSFTGSLLHTASISGTHTFTVEVTDVNGCTAMTNPITVSAGTPDVTAANNGPVCVGNTIQLTGTVDIGTYYWTGPNGFTATQLSPVIPNAQFSDAGQYVLHATFNGCSSTANTNVNIVGGIPTLNVTTNNPCAGSGSDSLEINAIVTGMTGITYQWTMPWGATWNGGYHIAYGNPTTAYNGVYSVAITGTVCGGGQLTLTGSVTVTVGNTPTITVSNNGPVCPGSTLQLTGTVSNGTYYWTGPGGFNSTLLSPSVSNVQSNNAGNYVLHATDGGCSAQQTTNVTVLGTPSATALTSGSLCQMWDSAGVYVSTTGMTGMTYSWTASNGFTSNTWHNTFWPATVNHAGTYTVIVSGTSCSGPVTFTSTVTVSDTPCNEVWPGDADNSFNVNNWDYLNIGLAYGATGAPRVGANTNWVGQYATDWSGSFNNGVNYKFADCNGDGVVNGGDTSVVTLNYGEYHFKGDPLSTGKSTAYPDLYFDVSGLALYPGATITVPIKLGTSSLMMQNIYGIAAQIRMTGTSLPTPMSVSSQTSWMGDNSNSMVFTKTISNTRVDWTFVRTDHTNVSGDGTIGTVTFTIPSPGGNQQVRLLFDNVKMVNKDGNEIVDVNLNDGYIYPLSAANVQEISNSIIVVPNPSHDRADLHINLSEPFRLQINITDMMGKQVWRNDVAAPKGNSKITLPTHLAPGTYSIQVKGIASPAMKWIKQ